MIETLNKGVDYVDQIGQDIIAGVMDNPAWWFLIGIAVWLCIGLALHVQKTRTKPDFPRQHSHQSGEGPGRYYVVRS